MRAANQRQAGEMGRGFGGSASRFCFTDDPQPLNPILIPRGCHREKWHAVWPHSQPRFGLLGISRALAQSRK